MIEMFIFAILRGAAVFFDNFMAAAAPSKILQKIYILSTFKNRKKWSVFTDQKLRFSSSLAVFY